jgi:hypothetical protein
MSELPDPIQTLFAAIMVAATMVAAAPQLFVQWLSGIAEQQRLAVLRQQAIQQDLLRMLAMRDIAGSGA